MPVRTLRDLLVEELRDIYHAEKQLVRALPKLARSAHSESLVEAFEEHHHETQGQVQRLERVFDQMGVPARTRRCEAMQGLIEEANEMIAENWPPELLDVALIGAAQKVEHYEISSYGTAIALANSLGLEDVAELLHETLEEERATDERLNQLAEEEVNPHALDTHGDEEEADDGRYVGSGRFDASRETGPRLIRANERQAAQRLRRAGASQASADWGAGAGHSEQPEPYSRNSTRAGRSVERLDDRVNPGANPAGVGRVGRTRSRSPGGRSPDYDEDTPAPRTGRTTTRKAAE